MQYYKIELTIGKDGSVTEKVIASGAACTDVTKGLEEALGEKRSQELLSEYNQQSIESSEAENIWNQM